MCTYLRTSRRCRSGTGRRCPSWSCLHRKGSDIRQHRGKIPEVTKFLAGSHIYRTLAAIAPPGDARVDWKIIRALSEVAGKTLPYNDEKQLRQRMTEVAPHLIRYGNVEEPIIVKNSQLAQVPPFFSFLHCII